ncbi:MAG: SH3 domain-containing protein [Anaerolineae bacterium]|nr:SH3 domain-containing protein [Anaerolineae bacterium]
MGRCARITGLVALAAGMLLAAGPWGAGDARAASDATLTDVVVGCESFSVTVTFRGTVDEENGFDYVRLRVVDAAGTTIYQSDPLGALVGETVAHDLLAGYAEPLAAGPVLLVLDDYDPVARQQLPSLTSLIVEPSCEALPPLVLPTVTTTCAVRLRTGPGLNYRWRAFLPEGTTFTVIGRLFDASWLEVRVEDSRIGWVFDGACVPGSPQAHSYEYAAVTFFRTADEVLLYEFELPPPEAVTAPESELVSPEAQPAG